ncbi:lanC-like protein GCL2 isoform X2 [Hordeum vulgare subsp. vulgare]|uniref:LanC-like protein GCL2 n=1 Tax=Hordeum vulgare subsp. vulgare TaxID=112509 RepID=A0A8I6WJ36_HORVV|nr:lanC-like protein GCL2 isoform X2 [Hordeum vulgare subsp. vulgare]
MGNGDDEKVEGLHHSRQPPHGETSSSSPSSRHATKRRRAHGAAAAMADRFFPNDLPDFVAEAPDGGGPPAAGLRGLLSLPYPRLSDRLLRAALRLKDKVVQETWTRTGGQVTDYTLYTGALGTALLLFKAFQVTGDRRDLNLASDIVQACDVASLGLPFLTFISGRAGVCALGAVIAKHCNDQLMVTNFLSSFDEIIITEKVPNELLYGRAGYLWACLFLNEHLSDKTIPAEHISSVAKDIIREGRKLSNKGSCPLMYEWHGKKYWGAAHGLAGIMHVLMHTELKLDEQDDVKNTLRYMISNRFPSGNYPSSEDSESDRLVHWCHGTPGVALTLAKAYQVFQDDHFKQSAAEAAEVVWNRGLLKRVGICHGISGNAYVFLSLYRLTGNVEYLYRAKAFACFLLENADRLIAEEAMHGGDRPFSLFEGKAGMAYLLLDMVNPSESRFPAYEL